jgi:hypothetical protein
MPKPVYWIGEIPEGCQLTGRSFNGTIYDAKLPRFGWGVWNQETFEAEAGSLGTGLGQKYHLQDDGRWLKVAG